MNNLICYIRCKRCGQLTPRSGNRRKYCPECAKIVKEKREIEYRRHRAITQEKAIRPIDNAGMIQACLTCTLPKCTNCLKKPERRKDFAE